MDMSLYLQIALLYATLLVLPAYFLISLARAREASALAWLLRVLYTGLVVIYVIAAARWDWLSYHFRLILPGMFVGVAAAGYRRIRRRPFVDPSGRAWWRAYGGSLVTVAVVGMLLAFTLRGYTYSASPVHLAFPLQGGWYYVVQGGDATPLNYHNVHRAQRYAIDIVELNRWGIRASGIYPDHLERYVIFGRTVGSPCDGTIVTARDSHPDQIPPAADRDHPAGNHVVVACHGVNVVLAHLLRGSVRAQVGRAVRTGDPIGRVGNSGNTSEPHLHVHAVRPMSGTPDDGEATPMLFDGTFPVRNSTF
jgi:hypothetical protein